MNTAVQILHIFGCMNRGGAEMRTVELMRHIRGSGYVQDFCVLSGKRGELDDEIRSLGGSMHYLMLDLGFTLKFLKLLRSCSYSVVHSHVFYVSGIIVMLAYIAGVPRRVVHFRSMNDGKPLTLLRRLRNWILTSMIDVFATDILAVSEGSMENAWGKFWRKDSRCRIVYSGFSDERYYAIPGREEVRKSLGIDADAKVIISVGRLDPAKNHGRLARIFVKMLEYQPKLHLLLVGKGSNEIEAGLRAFFQIHGVDSKVSFLGTRNDVASLLAAADAMLFPSLREGLPGAVVEARIAGIPVITSDLPGVREIAQYVDGIVIMSLDNEDSFWADAVLQQLSEKRLRRIELLNTPFSINRAAASFKGIWSGKS